MTIVFVGKGNDDSDDSIICDFLLQNSGLTSCLDGGSIDEAEPFPRPVIICK